MLGKENLQYFMSTVAWWYLGTCHFSKNTRGTDSWNRTVVCCRLVGVSFGCHIGHLPSANSVLVFEWRSTRSTRVSSNRRRLQGLCFCVLLSLTLPFCSPVKRADATQRHRVGLFQHWHKCLFWCWLFYFLIAAVTSELLHKNLLMCG